MNPCLYRLATECKSAAELIPKAFRHRILKQTPRISLYESPRDNSMWDTWTKVYFGFANLWCYPNLSEYGDDFQFLESFPLSWNVQMPSSYFISKQEAGTFIATVFVTYRLILRNVEAYIQIFLIL